ncbi:MAG: sigma-70 family RNA polymerase sigma factor [Lentisphaeraceae bacterium]|nr:sigma-70 family RNA polymerase sigma factor [Lentisphaeraceae bacterium]
MNSDLSAKISSLVEEHEVALVRYAASVTKDAEQARDIVQDAYIKLIKALQQGKEIKNEKSWLYRVCHNSALDFYRTSRRRQEKREDILQAMPKNSSGDTPEKILNKKEDSALVLESIESLNEREQTIINLKVRDNLSYKEIAAELDLTVNNVGFILHRAMKKLAAIFKDKAEKEVCR